MSTEFYNFDYLVPGQRNAHLQWNATLDQIDQAIHDMVISGGGTPFTEADVRATSLTGLPSGSSAVVVASDNVLTAFGKLNKRTQKTRTNVGSGSLASGWTNYGSPWDEAHYVVFPWGEVHLGGLVKPASGHGDTIFTLPSGARPAGDIILAGLSDGPVLTRFNVRATGEVQAAGVATPDYVSLFGLRFLLA